MNNKKAYDIQYKVISIRINKTIKDGFKSYNEADRWINNYYPRQTTFAIVKEVRHYSDIIGN